MSHKKSALPVYTADKQLLYYAPISDVDRLVASKKVRGVGRNGRVWALIAPCGDLRDLALIRPRSGEHYVHCEERDDNPRGVWSFSRMSLVNAA